MGKQLTKLIADNYDRLAEAYAGQLFHEEEKKPLDGANSGARVPELTLH